MPYYYAPFPLCGKENRMENMIKNYGVATLR
jgi:hypothetical protein